MACAVITSHEIWDTHLSEPVITRLAQNLFTLPYAPPPASGGFIFLSISSRLKLKPAERPLTGQTPQAN
ncbi:hypothetical protein AERO8C_130002 [Aeromonas veronii]|uniref:Uncharacterized protein n=1 Tax=Aeromonas veronii TaxID=654 RepID=A0A653KSM4_AERVE|nr:hypothetical protein AERO8C_130002 [Aeromonas veronii]